MNNQEAKFILGAYRADGRDAADPTFAEALAHAEKDPELRAWLEGQRKFDTKVGTKLRELAPPPGLREAILAGSRVSAAKPERTWWRHPAWLAAAAAMVVVASVTVFRFRPTGPTGAELAAYALRDLADAHDNHTGRPPGLGGVQAQLVSMALPLPGNLKLDLDELRQKKCRTVTFAGREMFEICFQRNGTWFHLYAARRADFAPGSLDPKALLTTNGEFASTVWSDGGNVYALVTHAGAEALRRLI